MSVSITEGLRHHQAGRLDQAELVYRQVLDADGQDADALHLLGVVAHQRGQAPRAVQLIGRAVAIRPDVAAFRSNLAEAYRASGDLAKAAEQGREAVRLHPASHEARNNLGLILAAQGKRDEAAGHYEEAVRIKPDFALARVNLGNVRHEQGRDDDAEAAYREAVRLDPALPQARCNLGQLLLERGQPEEALEHLTEAVRIKPDFPEALNNLGNVLRRLGRTEEAKDSYARALHLLPGLAMASNNMAQALQDEGLLDEAASWYARALEAEPRNGRVHANFAGLLARRDRQEEALARYRLALQFHPEDAEAHHGLGQLLLDRGDPAGARGHLEAAVRRRPTAPGYRSLLGQVLAEVGEVDAAVESFREALRQEPRHSPALAQMATTLRDKLPDDDKAAIERLLDDPELSDNGRAALHLGLAHALDARKEHQAAAEHMRLGNAAHSRVMERENRRYSPAEHSRFVDRLIENFTKEAFDRARGWGSESDRPIFIVGMPRSGTTLTEQVLASHPKVFGAGELQLARDAFDSLPSVTRLDLPPAACAARATRENLDTLAERHLQGLRALDPDHPRVADKMPDNYSYLGLLAMMFPEAKFIHCRRDVRDVAMSCWITHFRSIRWASDLEHIAGRVLDYQRLMEHWRAVLPVPLLEVDYEDTVADLEGVARRLVEWVGLEWDPACLAFHSTKRPIRTASVTQVRQPIYTRSVARWRPYEAALAPLLGRLEGDAPESR